MKLKKEEIDKLFKEGAELQKTFGIKSNWHNIGNHSITKTQYDACLRRFKEEANRIISLF